MTSSLVLLGNSKDGTINTFDLTGDTLTPLAVSEVGVPGLPLAVDARRDLVFAGTTKPGGVTTMKLDRATGTLEAVGRVEAPGAMVYLRLSDDGSRLFWASYHDGVGGVFTVDESGALHPLGDEIHYPNLHSVQVSADGRFAYFVSLHDDLIAQYSVTDAGLAPLDPPTVAAPEGSGPRHIIVTRDQESVFVNTEYSGEVLHYRRDPASGTLDFIASQVCIPTDRGLTHSRFGADPRAEDLIWGADLHLDDSETRLYCSERTRATITALDIASHGVLGEMIAHSDVVAQPRGFAILPNGDLLVASEIDRIVGQYRPDGDSALSLVASFPAGLGAYWIEVIDR
ncbi:beta-propeller fold lactonase family protein [Propionimicrobium sp. PCR01-08-3]|uniref:lactonase family protein n=1 Tax=Propionimicrobium sp. PCR01-08-3 TaxID=3052086 RepID=UPI00255CEDB0|nr:beta-propeller fold lactonase family protein [Propionimicrobium sp. PCR01-08-3]WIY83058.1 beta-propeller fold lactonase family protein [Propionimicrobium sp. PCR01-08-3]